MAILRIHYTTFMSLWWRLGAVYRWNFYTGVFLAENVSSPFLGQIFDFGVFFQGLDIDFEFFCFLKWHTLGWFCIVWAITRVNLPSGQPVVSQQKKVYIILEKFLLYFIYLLRSPKRMDLHEILHRGSSRRRNRSFQILCRSVEGFRNCEGSNFVLLLSLSWSLLTQGCAIACLWWATVCGQINHLGI